jgi:hypothetical protein
MNKETFGDLLRLFEDVEKDCRYRRQRAALSDDTGEFLREMRRWGIHEEFAHIVVERLRLREPILARGPVPVEPPTAGLVQPVHTASLTRPVEEPDVTQAPERSPYYHAFRKFRRADLQLEAAIAARDAAKKELTQAQATHGTNSSDMADVLGEFPEGSRA